jgi:DNA-binding CsgD family transcriptional regulator
MGERRPTRRRREDEVAVLEAAYRLDGTEAEWLEELARVGGPLLDEGLGVAATTWSVEPGRLRLRELAVYGGPPGTIEAVRAACDSNDLTFPLAASGPCTSLSASRLATVAESDPGSQMLFSMGVRDCLTVLNMEPGGFCSGLTAYRPNRVLPSRRFIARWSRVSSHLGAGFRIRRGLQTLRSVGCDALAGGEAILTPEGRVEHVEEPAKQARKLLAQGVVAMGRARGKLRMHDADAALDAWKGLVAGRWSLIERVDTDGRRFLVAHKNDPEVHAPPTVTLRERQIMAARGRGLSIKLIAYELGLSSATVSRALRSGMTKLGLVHESELTALFTPSLTARRPA